MKNSDKNKIKILVSDRNPNVRTLLYREMKASGYDVILAGNGYELLNNLKKSEYFDLLILDPELINNSREPIIETINHSYPDLPIIIHSFHDNVILPPVLKKRVFIEKDGNSIERIKQYLRELLAVNLQ